MIDTPLVRRALQIATQAHRGQVDKGGKPYLNHVLAVAQQMTTEETTVAALLHDVVEDTPWTLADLAQAGVPPQVLEALALLTHQKEIPYLKYVQALAANPIARAVKRADLRHNSDLNRLPQVTERDLARVEKYRQALALLDEYL